MSGDSGSIELAPWVERIKARRQDIRENSPREVSALMFASRVLSGPRRVRKALRGEKQRPNELQLPWIPAFSGLTPRPFHDASNFPWARALEASVETIRDELHQVLRDFRRAVYDSDRNIKTWKTFYFYLHGKPVEKNLNACPTTRSLLQQIPLNGLHVCFSAIEPGGFLQPHTGPTNASLTAHLGLEGCGGSAIWVAGERRPYVEGKVLVFDDSFVHWVEHTGDKVRYTLMVTFWHPVNALERTLLGTLLKWAPDSFRDNKPNPLDRDEGPRPQSDAAPTPQAKSNGSGASAG
jgi:Aspartyl/Asparaginyl beta-hydroxylase